IAGIFLLDAPQPADPRSADDAAARRIRLGEVDTAVADRLHAGRHPVVHEIVHAPRFLRGQVLRDIEVAHLAAEANGKGGNIKTRDGTDAGLTGEHGLPGTLDRAADRGNDAESGDDDATFGHTLPVLRSGGRGRRSEAEEPREISERPGAFRPWCAA